MNLEQFAALSQVLTGYGQEAILPKLDTQHQAAEYLATLYTPGLVPVATLQLLTDTWNTISAMPQPTYEMQVKEQIMGNTELAPVAKNIIYMWFLGIWYDLTVPPGTSPNKDFVVSAQAYQNSLVWDTMGAHPMGYSEGVFGYWNTPPVIPPLHPPIQ
ncbi:MULTISPECIES: hypothetical protein [unclassified Pedobacter]|uniref:hypothetical protein n=1 Tax=Pedobacter TaxID=84567 RepID=UPI000B4A8661|nr:MULTISPECIES: hypothetical protein [unclassified Pedobacter]MCX2585706.1 hypothetical protein [Pedobacter sp. MR22-3]OWK70400.1 hypothetical protein CBW18_13155 [Pedobacter sp. AJM]